MIKNLSSGIKYTHIDHLNQVATPYDLLLFHGSDTISSIVELGEELASGQDKFSHVGLYMTNDMFPDQSEQLAGSPNLILESTANIEIGLTGISKGIPDLLTGGQRIGVQMRNVVEVINHYLDVDNNNFIALGRLKHNLYSYPEKRANINQYSQVFLNTYKDRYYELNMLNLAAGAFSWLRPVRNFVNDLWWTPQDIEMPIYGFTKESDPKLIQKVINNLESRKDSEMLFCSELVGMGYKLIKTLPPTTIPCDISPVDYLNMDILQDLVYIVNSQEESKFINKFK